MTTSNKELEAEQRSKLADWLNAFKADPFSTGETKVDRLLELITALQGGGERL